MYDVTAVTGSSALAESNPSGGVRALAFYLPQFHPIPENDAWWGRGFTEWTNVVQARPLFDGHYQPHLPGDLGFYDLRLAEPREAQASLARAHGITGFVYHHYWFGGRRLLERPFGEVLSSGRPEFPFALCWANEHWTRRWDGRAQELLVAQEYGDEELERHAAWLAKVFADRRYIEVGGRPLLVIYASHNPPGQPGEYLKRLKEACVRHGSPEPYLVQVETHVTDRSPADNGCDAEVEFHPHRVCELAPDLAEHDQRFGDAMVFDYGDVAEGHLERDRPPWIRYPCVIPCWDNSPRVREPRRVMVITGSDPDLYGSWLREVTRREAGRDRERLVFLNAWNEWAEGAHLEPDLRHGRGYLEATREVFGAGEAPAPAATATVAAASPPDAASAYEELYERYVQAQRGRADDIHRGEIAAAATIADLERRLEARTRDARELEVWANDERRVRLAAEEWARDEQRVRLELQAAVERYAARASSVPSNGRARRIARRLGLGRLRRRLVAAFSRKSDEAARHGARGVPNT